jgi:hypothetical protein
MIENQPGDSAIQEPRSGILLSQPRLLVYGFVLSVTLVLVGWAGTTRSIEGKIPSFHPSALAHAFSRSSPALRAPMLTPMPMVTSTHPVYLPVIQRQVMIPGSLSIQEVYTANYSDDQQVTFRPCQAVALWVRMHNRAEIAQPAVLFWQTQEPTGKTHGNLSGHRQVNIPPGESVWRRVGGADWNAPAGEYRFQAHFTSGTDRQESQTTFTIEGEPLSMHLLEGYTAVIDPRNYDLTVDKMSDDRRVRANIPVRITDAFTFEDSDVVEITTWEGARENSYIKTFRFRPDGSRWGNLRRAWLDYELRPGCVRLAVAHWPIDQWVKQTPGQWRFDIFGGDFGGDEAFATSLYFTVQEAANKGNSGMR